MSRKSKAKYKNIKPMALPEALAATQLKVRNPGVGKYVSFNGMLGYAQVAFGDKQENHSAPLIVPPGFATQVPYNSAINSTIIQNTSAIPVTTFYQAMIADPIAYQCMLYMITTIIARIGEYNNPDKECQDLIRSVLKRIGKIKLCQALLTALWAGFASLKLNWGDVNNLGEYEAYIDDNGYTVPKNVLLLPPDSVMLAVTPEGELDPEFGVMQYYYNLNSEWNQNQKAFSYYGNAPLAAFSAQMSPQRQVAFNPMFLSALAKDWRIHHVFNPTGLAGNWWGNSMIASVFSNIVDKNNVKFKIQVGATYKASPMAIFETDTQTMVDVPGGTSISMAQNVQQTLAGGAANGYYIIEGLGAVKYGTIDNTMKFDEMVKLLDHYNSEIRAGLCTPNITGNDGSYANAVSNNDNNDTIINNITLHTIDTIMNQFVTVILDNAIDRKIEDYGHFELLDNSLDDKAIWSKILEGGKAMGGVIDPSSLDDVNFCRKKIGLPPVDKLSDDLIFGMGQMISPGKGANMQKTKESIGAPYAGGIKAVTDRTYSK